MGGLIRIIEGILIDSEDILIGVLLAGNLSNTLKGFAETVRNRNPRGAAIGGAHGLVKEEKEKREEREIERRN